MITANVQYFRPINLSAGHNLIQVVLADDLCRLLVLTMQCNGECVRLLASKHAMRHGRCVDAPQVAERMQSAPATLFGASFYPPHVPATTGTYQHACLDILCHTIPLTFPAHICHAWADARDHIYTRARSGVRWRGEVR